MILTTKTTFLTENIGLVLFAINENFSILYINITCERQEMSLLITPVNPISCCFARAFNIHYAISGQFTTSHHITSHHTTHLIKNISIPDYHKCRSPRTGTVPLSLTIKHLYVSSCLHRASIASEHFYCSS